MRSLVKSLVLALMGTGVFFSFLMMTVIPVQAALARFGGNISKLSVVVNPASFLRNVGVPMAALVFLLLFTLAMYKLRQAEKEALARH